MKDIEPIVNQVMANYQYARNIIQNVRDNEEIAERYFNIEKRILQILNFHDLFEALLSEISIQLKVPFAWISVIKESEILEFIQSKKPSFVLQERLNIVEKQTFADLMHSTVPLLINRDLRRYKALIPKNRRRAIKSIAISPLTLDGELIGSLNQADTSKERWSCGMDTTHLEQLAIKVSLCLSNVTAHEKLRYMAYRDPLTGLINRRVMETIIKREFARHKRYRKYLSVVFIDLDKFKPVNDTYGHDCGDALLVHVANLLTSMCRDIDVVSRFAGDEFVLILPETTGQAAVALMQRIAAQIAKEPLQFKAHRIPVQMSFGVACTIDPRISDAEALLIKADRRMYNDKQSKG
jgi:diguanylate cyclase (GGDEF)-like protein